MDIGGILEDKKCFKTVSCLTSAFIKVGANVMEFQHNSHNKKKLKIVPVLISHTVNTISEKIAIVTVLYRAVSNTQE